MSSDKTELRGLAPTELVQALDAIAHSEGMDRTAYVNRVLDEHCRVVAHKSIVLFRMLRGNPYLAEPGARVKE
jgi:hypothetical protein